MDFSGYDPMAELRIDGDVLTLRFRFADLETAMAARDELLRAHARGEDVTITLSAPVPGELQ